MGDWVELIAGLSFNYSTVHILADLWFLNQSATEKPTAAVTGANRAVDRLTYVSPTNKPAI